MTKKAKAKREKKVTDPGVRGWKTLPTIPLTAEEYQRMQEDKARVGAETWREYYDMLITHGVAAPCREGKCTKGEEFWDATTVYYQCPRCHRLTPQEG